MLFVCGGDVCCLMHVGVSGCVRVTACGVGVCNSGRCVFALVLGVDVCWRLRCMCALMFIGVCMGECIACLFV